MSRKGGSCQKLTKLCLHLLKLCRENCGLFFSRTRCILHLTWCIELENSVSQRVQETDDSVTEKVGIREKHAALKKVYKDLKESYKSLKMMTEQQQQLKPKQLNFVDGRVRELWKMAQQANMTEDELSSFRVRPTL